MRRVLIDSLQPGVALGKTIYNDRGDALLKRGTLLNERYISILRQRGFTVVFVREGEVDDGIPDDIVSERLRTVAVRNISRLYEVVTQASTELKRRSAGEIQYSLRNDQLPRELQDSTMYRRLYNDVESIIAEVLDVQLLTGLTSIKSHDNYTFCHSVDVTITAVMIGKKMLLGRASLRHLAAGCMLHDIGKVFVDDAILNRPGKLDAQEFEKVKQHATLGYELLHRVRQEEIMANSVAHQHHERQNGQGYPQGLRGNNHIYRDPREPSGGRITLIGEIAAVADVYDALCSDRPYRAAMAPEQVVKTITEMAGVHLNREVVQHFLSIVPTYPLGIDVNVHGGCCDGYRGMVARLNEKALDRPVVRLLRDNRGRPTPTVEIDLSQNSAVTISSCFRET